MRVGVLGNLQCKALEKKKNWMQELRAQKTGVEEDKTGTKERERRMKEVTNNLRAFIHPSSVKGEDGSSIVMTWTR
jgi:hypothetical protein